MKARDIPNLITCTRILLVYPIIQSVLESRFVLGLGLFVLAGLSDALDGFLAKQYHWQSRLGSYLDPLADKLLLVSSFLALSWLGLIPAWLTLAVVLRDVIILAGAIAYYFLLRPYEGRPHWTSKANTFFQLLLVFLVLLSRGLWSLPAGLFDVLFALVFGTSVISGAVYVYVWGGSYWRETHPAR